MGAFSWCVNSHGKRECWQYDNCHRVDSAGMVIILYAMCAADNHMSWLIKNGPVADNMGDCSNYIRWKLEKIMPIDTIDGRYCAPPLTIRTFFVVGTNRKLFAAIGIQFFEIYLNICRLGKRMANGISLILNFQYNCMVGVQVCRTIYYVIDYVTWCDSATSFSSVVSLIWFASIAPNVYQFAHSHSFDNLCLVLFFLLSTGRSKHSERNFFFDKIQENSQ